MIIQNATHLQCKIIQPQFIKIEIQNNRMNILLKGFFLSVNSFWMDFVIEYI